MMPKPPLAAALEQQRDRSAISRAVYDRFVDRLRALEIGRNALRAGDRFPDFALPDDHGRYRSLTEIGGGRPLVLSFNRGGWCPYCRTELAAWRDALPALEAAGGALAIVTAEIGGRARALADLVAPSVEVFCDVDHGLALELGLAFHVGAEMIAGYRAIGLDLATLYGSAAGLLPVPATFVILPDGIIAYAFAQAEFRLRAEPGEVIRAVAALAG